MFKKIITVSAILFMLVIVTPILAQTTPTASSNTSKIACVGAAVNTRELSISTAMTVFTGASNAAYAARTAALQQAYQLTTLSEVKTAVKAAWSAFKSSMKSARQAWQTARNAAWSQYRKAVAACKAPSSIRDGANSSLESSGN